VTTATQVAYCIVTNGVAARPRAQLAARYHASFPAPSRGTGGASRQAEGKAERLPDLAAELAVLKVRLLVISRRHFSVLLKDVPGLTGC
jgi:hypothetical protein